jgi:general secretion pathway protein C
MFANLRRKADRATAQISPATLVTGLELVLILGLGIATARLVWTIVTPIGPIGNWQGAGAGRAPVDTRIIGSFDPFFRSSTDSGTARVSSLSLTLLGTRVDTVSGRGSAIIAITDGRQSSYLVGETITPGVTLKAVGFDYATLVTGAGEEKLFLDQSAGGTPVQPPPASLDASNAPTALAPPAFTPVIGAPVPPPRLAADVSATPRMKGSQISGFVLSPKGSGAAFSAAGLLPGDVLVTVDGAPVASIGDPSTLVHKLDAGGVYAGVERNGKVISLQIKGSR